MSPQELYDSAGNKVEVKTDEEFATAQDDARQEGRTEGKKDAEADFTEQLNDKTTEVDTLKADLVKAEEKGENFSKIREKNTEEKKESEENKKLIEDLTKQVNDGNTNLRNFVVGGVKSDAIKKLVGDDEDLQKKLEANYSRISGPEDSKEQIIAKTNDAFAMLEATGVKIEATEVETGGGGKAVGGEGQKFGGHKLSQEAKDMANKELGISDKDLDTYLK